MSFVSGPFDSIRDIKEKREALRLKVRVIRIWELCQPSNPSNVWSIEMVFLDAEGGRIQASIRKPMIKKFKNFVVEGGVYKMTYFGVTDNDDFIGVLKAVGEEKVFKKIGRDIRVLELELMDDKGSIKCSSFGHFIDIMKSFLVGGVEELGILVIQFAKVKSYLGQVSLQSVSNSTRLMWNPQIPEVISFKDRLLKLKLEVSDVTETAHFVIFDYDAASLLCKSCASMVGDAKIPSREYPAELDNLIGKELLFKLEIKNDRAFRFDDSFKVRRICDDEDIIREFKQEKSVQTPEMLKFKAPVDLSNDEVAGGDNEQGYESVGLAELYNEGEINSPTVGGSSTSAACMAPQKRKGAARVGRGSSVKKSGTAKALKIEKD
ncbi:Nucleic acid-binding, OB-fold [Sesbania bispinosa]|nr:Nucleic acid-binding, OB-fold [Sesbania bispinosa]